MEIKRFVTWLWANVITTAWGGVPNGTLSIMFTCCPNLMFLASPLLKIYRFSNWTFCYFEEFKIDIYFTNFGQVKIDHIWSSLLTLDSFQLFYWLWVRHVVKNNSNPLCLIKIQEPHMRSGTIHFQWSKQQEWRTGFLSQWISFKAQSFTSSCSTFFWFLRQNEICIIRIKTKSFT